MIKKEEIINKLLENNVVFAADGHEVTITQSNNQPPLIKIDNEISTKEDILQYNHIVVPATKGAFFGLTEMDFEEDNHDCKAKINEIKPENVGKIITVTGTLANTTIPEPIIDTAIYECRSCMRLHEVAQKTKKLIQPAVCTECGGRKFKLLPTESKYTEIQDIEIMNSYIPDRIKVFLKGSRCSYDKYCASKPNRSVAFRGVLMVDLNEYYNQYYVDYAEDITEWYRPILL